MPKPPSLLQDIEQFIYNYAPNALYKKPLFDIVKKWEEAYLQRIYELENKPAASESSRMTDEGGIDFVDYEDMRGNRYD